MYKNGLTQYQHVAVVVLTGDACESQTEQVLGEEGCPHPKQLLLASFRP